MIGIATIFYALYGLYMFVTAKDSTQQLLAAILLMLIVIRLVLDDIYNKLEDIRKEIGVK